MADKISSLFVEFRASTDKFNSDLKAAQKEVREFEKSVKPTTELLNQFGKTALVAGGALVAAFGLAVKSAADYGDHLNDLSKRSGASVENLSRLGFAAQQSGSDLDGLATGLKLLAKNMTAAVDGSKEQIDAFKDAGISSRQLADAHGDVNKVMLLLADKFKVLPDGAQKTALAMRILGKSGSDLIPMLNEGSDGLTRMGDAAQKAGLVMSKEAAAAADEFNDRLAELEGAAKGLGLAIGQALMPSVQRFVEFLAGNVSDVARFTKEHENLTKAMAALALAITGAGGLLLALSVLGSTISKVSAAIVFLTGAETAAAGATVLLTGALAALPFVAIAIAAADLAKNIWDIYNANKALDALEKDSASSIEGQHAIIQRNIDKLKEHGIVIDKTGKSWEQLAVEVHAANDAFAKLHPFVPGPTPEQLEAMRKFNEEVAKIKFKAQQDSFQGTRRAEADMRGLLDDQLDYHTKIYESETSAYLAELQKRIKGLDALDETIFSAQQSSIKMARDAEKAMRGDLDDSLDYHTKIYEEGDKKRQESREKVLKTIGDLEKKESDEAKRRTESQQRIWEQATANITSDFVKAFSDVIFHAKNFGQAMKDIALKTAESMFHAFLTGLLSPLTSALSNIGRSLANAITGTGGAGGLIGKLGGLLGIGGAAAGTAAAATGTAAASGATASIIGVTSGGGAAGGLGATMAAFATNPITIAAAAALAAGLAIHHFVARGRRSANEFVQGTENPFGNSLSALVDQFNSAKEAGTLSLSDAKQARAATSKLWSDFLAANAQFASQGKTQAKVAEQSLAHMTEIFGPSLSKVFGSMDSAIKTLGGGSGIPATGGATSATTRFADAVDKIVPALNALADRILDIVPRGGQAITLTNEFSPSFTFYGVPESLQKEIRDTIEPQIVSDLQNNSRGITEKIKAALGL